MRSLTRQATGRGIRRREETLACNKRKRWTGVAGCGFCEVGSGFSGLERKDRTS